MARPALQRPQKLQVCRAAKGITHQEAEEVPGDSWGSWDSPTGMRDPDTLRVQYGRV
jgi:hypothetical protein